MPTASATTYSRSNGDFPVLGEVAPNWRGYFSEMLSLPRCPRAKIPPDCLRPFRRVRTIPMIRNVLPCAKPDTLVLAHVVEKLH